MNPTLRVPGGSFFHALLSLVSIKAAPTPPEPWPEPCPCGPDRESGDVSDLNEAPADPGDPDTALRKLSLTRDDARHPRPRKAPFDRDFEPFM